MIGERDAFMHTEHSCIMFDRGDAGDPQLSEPPSDNAPSLLPIPSPEVAVSPRTKCPPIASAVDERGTFPSQNGNDVPPRRG